ncbi:UPF0223 family protein [Ligilactobacillus ceti]|uniref:Uncharacterized protein n=1 Tax=Ligilactobacillus ceti DSM 22408 TaxID=1122146 RepID=A0A0R2KHS8_9LACO|nr:UPF0223 family protein [Ligilactobacillus ceti]KRN88931.1 hypothetical protein IV53_GL000901 [Ligilactobacillus ceti DSM 22408]
MKQMISYPLMPEWSTAEIIIMSEFFMAVEQIYTTGIDREEFLNKYQEYIKVEPSKMAQKQLDRAFSQESGYSIYQAVKFAQASSKKQVKIQA